ncbi:hypothetical protein WR25_09257 [Diploscapter pachys]|uniref:Transthyretin/hydroxyisourate hydrolase domain-containing protein n=1 Tax=Diploscapter pachys TaxID=2018661 RepID=A0A2A2LZS7_9BILA|nr:hypothetical protein WR25_09257 [Diploscapter pachys]
MQPCSDSFICFISLFVLVIVVPPSSANTECVWAIGQLKCDSHPDRLVNTVVEIWDEDGSQRGPLGLVDADDLAGRTVLTSKDEGIFKVEGCSSDHDWLGPLHRNRPEWYLVIIHSCNHKAVSPYQSISPAMSRHSLPSSMPLLVFLAISLLPAVVLAGRDCVWILGKVECEKDPSKNLNVEIRVLDRDGYGPLTLVDPDDLMGVTFTNDDGRFQLDGCGDDFDWVPGIKNSIEPYIKVRHYCNKEEGEEWTLPEFSKFVPDTYDVGTIKLDSEEEKKL